jgi:peptidoglycan/LPS O-acetylase OafA/YrhL
LWWAASGDQVPEPKIIEGKARRRPPLSKPLALIYIAIGIAMLVWVYFVKDGSDPYFFLTIIVSVATAFIVAELMRNLD